MNILQLLHEQHGIQARQVARGAKGREYHSPCPGCGGDDRFHVWPDQNHGEGSYWCRGCGKGGDAIQYLRDFRGMSYKESMVFLGKEMVAKGKTGAVRRSLYPYRPDVLKKGKWMPVVKARPEGVQGDVWAAHAEKFIRNSYRALLSDVHHLEWLANRGIGLASVLKWQLGLHATKGMAPSYRPRTSWGLPGGTNRKTGRPLKFILPAGVVIPWRDISSGELERIRIRLDTSDPRDPKKRYHAVAGSTMNSFVTRLDAAVYVVVETELDAIMLDEVAGDLVGAVAVGSSHAKPAGAAGQVIMKAGRVINALDYDKAGKGASSWWEEQIPQSIRRPVPLGTDPGEFFQKAGAAAVRKWVVNGLPAATRHAVMKGGMAKKQSGSAPPLAWLEKAGRMTVWCYEQLQKNEKTRSVLAKMGIGQDLVERFVLGWNPEDIWRAGASWGLPEIEKIWLPAGFVIPLVADSGEDVHRVRIIPTGEDPIDHVVPGSSGRPFVTRNDDPEVFVVVGSELDAIRLAGAAGDLAGFVTLGSRLGEGDIQPWLSRAKRLILCFDGSDKDQAASVQSWCSRFPQAVKVPMTGPEGPGAVVRQGKSAIRDWVKKLSIKNLP